MRSVFFGDNKMDDFDYARRIKNIKKENPFIRQAELVYKIVYDDIFSFRYRAPGSKLNQDQIASLLGVSRSPVRDAFKRLIADGVIDRKSRNGYYVRIISMKDVTHISEFRSAIETQAVLLAAIRAAKDDIARLYENNAAMGEASPDDIGKLIDLDVEFHNLLVSCSKNDYLIKAYNNEQVTLMLLRNCTMAATALVREKMHLRHGNIIKAIENRNPKQADEAIRAHLEGNAEDYLEIEKKFYNQ